MGFMERMRGSFQKGIDETIERRKPVGRQSDEKSQELLDYEEGYRTPIKPFQKLGEAVETLRPVGEKIVPFGKKIIQFADEATRPKEGAASAEARINRIVGGSQGGLPPSSYQTPNQGKLPFSQSQDDAVKRILGSGYTQSTHRSKVTADDIMNIGIPRKSVEKRKPKNPKR